jgi:hypothetical protein
MSGKEDNSPSFFLGAVKIFHPLEKNMIMNPLSAQPGKKKKLRRNPPQVPEGRPDQLFPFLPSIFGKGQSQVPPGYAPVAVVDPVEKPAQCFKKKYPPGKRNPIDHGEKKFHPKTWLGLFSLSSHGSNSSRRKRNSAKREPSFP